MKVNIGISADVVRKISKANNEPQWMLDKRLKALEYFNKTKMPKWGPNLSTLDLNDIVYFSDPNTDEKHSWDEVPEDIKEIFDKLGIPEAEKKSLSGVGAQYDSKSVYHNLKKEWEEKGIIFESMDNAIHKYPKMVKQYFMTRCVPITDHKFAMLHAAVWSGGTFIYIPPNIKIDIPLQAYFRMNAMKGGQFEHTIIIADINSEVHYVEGCSSPKYSKNSLHAGCVEIFAMEGSTVKYSSIENWSKNMYNLNTKRALVFKNGKIQWLGGNLGAHTTMLYPTSVLFGDNSKSDSFSIVVSGKSQTHDVGTKAIHLGKNTSSIIRSKSISKDGGISNYRGLIKVHKLSENAISSVECDGLILDEKSINKTYPAMEIERDDATISHEAKVGKISEKEIFFLMSRGISEKKAKQMIVSGFAAPIIKKLPLEYALELNKLIEIETQDL